MIDKILPPWARFGLLSLAFVGCVSEGAENQPKKDWRKTLSIELADVADTTRTYGLELREFPNYRILFIGAFTDVDSTETGEIVGVTQDGKQPHIEQFYRRGEDGSWTLDKAINTGIPKPYERTLTREGIEMTVTQRDHPLSDWTSSSKRTMAYDRFVNGQPMIEKPQAANLL